MFHPNSFRHLKEIKGHRDLETSQNKEDAIEQKIERKIDKKADPNDPLGFADLTKTFLHDIDRDIEKLREWRQKEQQNFKNQIFENKKNLELQRRENLKQKLVDEIIPETKCTIENYQKELDKNNKIYDIQTNILYEKIDPKLDGKIGESEQRLQEMQQNYERQNFEEPDEIKQLKQNLLKKFNFDFDIEEKEEVEEKFDIQKYKMMAQEFEQKELLKIKYVQEIEQELQELEQLMK